MTGTTESGPAPAPTASLDTAPLDLAMLEEMRAAMRPGAFAAVLDVFVSDTRQRLATARLAVGRGDGPALATECHSLKSTLGSFGATAAAALARRLEDAAAQDAAAAGPLLDRLEAASGTVLDELLARFSATPGGRGG